MTAEFAVLQHPILFLLKRFRWMAFLSWTELEFFKKGKKMNHLFSLFGDGISEQYRTKIFR
jgi:hypothetical protein